MGQILPCLCVEVFAEGLTPRQLSKPPAWTDIGETCSARPLTARYRKSARRLVVSFSIVPLPQWLAWSSKKLRRTGKRRFRQGAGERAWRRKSCGGYDALP